MTMHSILRLIPMPPGKIIAGKAFFFGQDLLKMTNEEIRHVRGAQIGLIFQDPMTSLNPVLSGVRKLAELKRKNRARLPILQILGTDSVAGPLARRTGASILARTAAAIVCAVETRSFEDYRGRSKHPAVAPHLGPPARHASRPWQARDQFQPRNFLPRPPKHSGPEPVGGCSKRSSAAARWTGPTLGRRQACTVFGRRLLRQSHFGR